MGIWDKMGLTTKCASCGVTQNLLRCPYCDKTVCKICLDSLVTRKRWPEWFIGRKIENYQDIEKVVKEYAEKVKAHGGNIHVCKGFLKYRMSAINKYLQAMQERFGKTEKSYEFQNKPT